MTNLTNNKAVLSWIDEMTAITKPDKIVWITGEEEQLDALREQAVKEGILIKLTAPTPTTWHAWRTARSSAVKRKRTQAPRTTG